MFQCANCGATNKPGARFCNSCGAALSAQTAALGGMQTMALGSMIQGRYTVLRLVGQGGMGAVYQVLDARLGGKPLAMKEMSDAAIVDPAEKAAAIAEFKQEAQLLAQLDHSNIPKVSDSFTENQKHYIIMEFVQGETLEARLARQGRPCNEVDVRDWALQLCDVLAYLHGQNPPVIFRDLKPGNIMITPQGQIKLIDFGIARLFKPGKSGDTHVMGTPGFASPEQYGQGQTDARSDIYSLGVVLHHLLTCYDPSTSMFKLPPVRQLNPSISPQMAQVVARATTPNVIQRYQTVAALQQDLRAGATKSVPLPPVPPPGPTVSVTPLPPSRGVPLWALALVALAMLAIGVGAAKALIVPPPSPRPVVVTEVVVPPTAGSTAIPTRSLPPARPTEASATPRPPVTPSLTPISPTVPPTRTPTRPIPPTDAPPPTTDWSALERAARSVVLQYGDAKPEFFNRLNPTRLTDFLVDPVLESQKRAVCWLRNERAYYVYSDRRLDVTNVSFQDERHATVLAQIAENRVLREQDGGVRQDFGRETYRAIYQLERRDNGRWYIYCLNALEDNDPIQCEIRIEGEDPCLR